MGDGIKEGYLRTTEIIQPFTGIEFIPDYILQSAGNFGTQCHYHIQNLLSGFETPVENDLMVGCLNSFSRFWKDSMHEFVDGKITLEKRLYDDVNMISGAVDCIIETESKTYVFDWKTSKAMHTKTFRLQGACYRYLLEINGYKNVCNPTFVQLHRCGKEPSLFTSENYDEDLERFFNCLDLYKYFEMEKTRKKWRD